MQLTLVFNVVVLTLLTLFFFREELRFRRFSGKVKEARDDLTMIAHQLRSPLANLRKYHEFLQSKEFGTLSFAQQEALSKIKTSLAESLIVLDRLLARARLEDAVAPTRPSSANLYRIVQAAVDAVSSLVSARKHTVSVRGMKRAMLKTDPLLLHGILDEILSNAVYYTPSHGNIALTIAEEGSMFSLSVRDNGIGIADEDRPHIFNKFFRGEKAKSMIPGSGLGLAFAKQFTERLGGAVRFESKIGKGSTFTVLLPKKGALIVS